MPLSMSAATIDISHISEISAADAHRALPQYIWAGGDLDRRS